MRLKALAATDKFEIVAVMDGDLCLVEAFLNSDDKQTKSVRAGFFHMLVHIAEHGFQAIPSGWSHEASKELGIYELIKGNFRLFYFKGAGKQIAVCSEITRKSGRKADPASVQKAAIYKQEYFDALAANNLILVDDDETEQKP